MSQNMLCVCDKQDHAMKPTLRIPNHLIAPWGAMTTAIQDVIAEERKIPPDAVSNADILERLLDFAAAGMGVGALSAPLTTVRDMQAALDDLRYRLVALEANMLDPPHIREKFWRGLEENPPQPGFAPILPGLEYVEEAEKRFPEIYGKAGSEEGD